MGLTIVLSAWTVFAWAGSAPLPPEAEGRFALLSDEESWRALPPAQEGGGQPLPSWARVLAGLMPRTTAAMLRLDYAHRTQSPLDPKLRAQMRFVGAHVNRCAYAQACALLDARRAGLSEGEVEVLRRGACAQPSPAVRAALEFAHKMCVDSDGVTDAEFAALVREYGARKTAAMVLLMAYANFQDRMLIVLGEPIETEGPRPPLEVVFAPEAWRTQPADRRAGPPTPFEPSVGRFRIEPDPEWTSLTYEQLQARLESQRQRPTRLRVPSWEEVERGLPPGLMRPNRVVWNLVHLGYVPELAVPWEILMRANAPEIHANLDRISRVNLFWVTTRADNCPYGMGHGEMLWELGGLTRSRIEAVGRVLAGDDWSSFPAPEQRALAFARKLTKAPWSVRAQSIESLIYNLGPHRAAAVIWWGCRGNYMTRVANGFQLSLERDNVLREDLLNPQAGPMRGRGSAGG